MSSIEKSDIFIISLVHFFTPRPRPDCHTQTDGKHGDPFPSRLRPNLSSHRNSSRPVKQMHFSSYFLYAGLKL